MRPIKFIVGWALCIPLYLAFQAIGLLRAVLQALGEYIWVLSQIGTLEASPFGFSASLPDVRVVPKKAPRLTVVRDEEGDLVYDPPAPPPTPVPQVQRVAAPKPAGPKLTQKTLKAVGCVVEPGWEVVSVSKEDGMREERNTQTGVHRLVHSGTGQVISADLSALQVQG